MTFDKNLHDNSLIPFINLIPGPALLLIISETNILSIVYFNDEVASLLGYTRDELEFIVKNDLFSLIHESDVKLIERIIVQNSFFHDRNNFEGSFRFYHKDGDVRWILIKINRDKGITCENSFVVILTDITKEKRFSQELLIWNERDKLTGIYNKETFFKKTERLLQKQNDVNFTFVLFDINNFKIINDMFGLERGDSVLRKIALTLEKWLQDIGTYGRLESDNFAACIPTSLFDVNIIITEIKQCFIDFNIDSVISISLGIYKIDDTTLPVDKISDRAQLALKSIKENLSQEFAFYDEKLHGALMLEQKLSLEIQEAFEKSEFELYLQPIYSISDQKIVSAEALIRWNHPSRGLLSSNLFVPISEKKGLITRLDAFVREEVCSYLHKRQKNGKNLFPISVNVSRLNIYNGNFCEELANTVKKYELNTNYLRIEITESAYVSDPDRLTHFIGQLHYYGFTVMMDDFGSEYSSLKMLKDVPVNILKIDSSFIKDIETSPRASSILSSVIRIARWLNIDVVAEGVETVNQFNFLRSMGCDLIQGFHYSKPLTVEEFDVFLEKNIFIPTIQESSILGDKKELDFIWKSDEKANFMFNNMLTISGIYELYEDNLEIVRVNDSYYEAFGTSPEILSRNAKNALKNVHEDDRMFLLNSCKRAEKSQKVESIEIRRRNDLSNEYLNVIINIRHLCNLIDRSVLFFTFEDVTKKKNIAIESSFREFLDVIKETYLEAYKIDTASQTSTLLLLSEKTPKTELVMPLYNAIHLFLTYVHPEDKNLVQTFFDKVFLPTDEMKIKNPSMTYRIKRSEEYIWITNTIFNLSPQNESNIFISCIKDITAEMLLAKTKNKLSESNKNVELLQEKMTILMKHSIVELWDYDTVTGDFHLVASSSHSDETNIIVNKTVLLENKDSFSKESRNALDDMIKKLENGEKEVSATYSVKEKNGDVLWKKAYYTSLRSKGINCTRATGIVIDITQEEKLRRVISSEAHYRKYISKNAIAFFECNLTTDEIITKDFLIERNLSPDTTLTELIESYFIPTLFPTDRKLIPLRQTTDEDKIKFEDETLYLEVRMNSRDKMFTGYRWRSVTVDYVTDPFTQQRHAFIYVRDIHKNKTEELLMREKASHDPLTGLLNRMAFEEQVTAIINCDKESYVPGVFLIMDIDNFRDINNNFGHLKGDETIRHAAKTLRSIFRSNDIIGRIGGDEMAVFMTNVGSKNLSLKKGNLLCTSFKDWGKLDKVTCSVGIAMATKNDISFEELYDKADKLYTLQNKKEKTDVFSIQIISNRRINFLLAFNDFNSPRFCSVQYSHLTVTCCYMLK